MTLLYGLIAIFAALLGYSVWQSKREPGRARGLMVLATTGILAGVVGSVYLTLRTPPPPKIPPQWNQALAEVMGRQVTKLAPQGGQVLVFILPEAMARMQATLGDIREQHQQGLQRGLAKNFTLTLVDNASATIPSFNGSFLTPEAFQEALRAYPDAKAVVSFLPLSTPLPDAEAGAGTPPKVIVFAATPELARSEIEAGRVHAAVVVRLNAAVDLWKTPKGDVQQVFDARYELLTAGSLR